MRLDKRAGQSLYETRGDSASREAQRSALGSSVGNDSGIDSTCVSIVVQPSPVLDLDAGGGAVPMVSRADRAAAACTAFVAATGCDGAAFTVMSSDSARELWCASDLVIARIASVQFSLGEGPALEAFITRRPVLIADVGAVDAAARWPAFSADVAELPVGGLFVFPLQLGAAALGVCELYRHGTGRLTAPELTLMLRAVDTATLLLLSQRAGELVDGLGWDGADVGGVGVLGERQVHQATGMLIAQLGVDAEQAFARLRAYAYAEGKDMIVVAEDIIARRLRLEPDPSPGGNQS